MAASTLGVGGNIRYWVGDRLGLQFNAGWYHQRNFGGGNRTSSVLLAPSVIVMFTRFDSNRDVNLRPYAGGGMSYARASVPSSASADVRNDARGMGGQVFGGVELTFLGARVSIS